MTESASFDAGRQALNKLDAVLAARPQKDDYVISDTVQALSTFRERLIPLADTATGRDRLETLNAVLSVVLGAHYPAGETPWPELEKARGWLAGLVEQER